MVKKRRKLLLILWAVFTIFILSAWLTESWHDINLQNENDSLKANQLQQNQQISNYSQEIKSLENSLQTKANTQATQSTSTPTVTTNINSFSETCTNGTWAWNNCKAATTPYYCDPFVKYYPNGCPHW